jgi:hypothetical protein
MSRRNRLPAVVFAAFLAVGYGMTAPDRAVQAQTQRRSTDTPVRTYQIRGSIRSAVNDQPLEMVRVDLKMFTGETVATAITRSNGEFEFVGLRQGEYFIEVSHDGFEPARERVEIMNSSRAGIYVFLRPAQTVAQSSGPPVSARELSIPRKAGDSYNKGMEQLVLKKEPEGSLRHFDKALAALPSYYEAHHMRGVAYFQLGRLQEAEREFQASLEKSGHKYAEPYFGLAALSVSAQKYAEAIESAQHGLALDDKAWRGYFELARAYLGLNRLPEAAKAIEQAKQLKPEFADIYLISANINIRRQDGPALLADFEAYLKVQPSGPVADEVRKRREAIRSRMAQNNPGAPIPEKKP